MSVESEERRASRGPVHENSTTNEETDEEA